MFETNSQLNYIYDINGKNVIKLSSIEDNSIIFVKRDPGFRITERDTSFIIVSKFLLIFFAAILGQSSAEQLEALGSGINSVN